MKYYAIIVGGGSGSRMKSPIPKQFLLLNGKPVIMHTIEAFYHSDLRPELILALNIDYYSYWEQLCREHNFVIPHTLVKGGNQRFDSVKNGLKAVKGNAVIAIHDAVRPIVSNHLITASFKHAELHGNAVAAVNATDSIRKLNGKTSVALNREEIYLIQTPQTFRSDVLKKAYKQPYRIEFTDDASVVEKSGTSIELIAGDPQNIKITYQKDILLAEFYQKASQKNNPH
jgi:2-C-methyl-D-erythritol 4-phosphate cytidylyltransferase